MVKYKTCDATGALPDTRHATLAHGVGRVVGVLGSEAGFAGSMLN